MPELRWVIVAHPISRRRDGFDAPRVSGFRKPADETGIPANRRAMCPDGCVPRAECPREGVAEAGYVRFAYGQPLAVVATAAWMLGPGELPRPGWVFWISVMGAGVLQIVATMSLLQAFRVRDFAVGTI